MAPRGGRGGGGSSRSSGSRSSSSSNSVWTAQSPLYGSYWTSGSAIAQVVFAGLFMITLIAIRIWFSRFKRSHYATTIWRGVMQKRWATAIWFGILFYIWLFIERILHEQQVVVANIYYIFEFILLSTGFIQEIALLFVTYSLIYQCLLYTSAGAASQTQGKKIMHYAHKAVIAILTVLYIVYFALGLKYIVDIYNGGGSSLAAYYYSDVDVYHYIRIHVAYQAIYFVATLEILALSFFLFLTKSKRGLPGSAMIFFIALVAFPGFIRSTFLLAFTVRGELEGAIVGPAANAAEDFITGAAQMLVYIGIILSVVAIAKGSPAITAPVENSAMSQQPAAVPSQYQQQPYYAPQPQPHNGQEVKPYTNGGAQPQQAYYPPPQQNGYPQPQAGYPQQNGTYPQNPAGYQQAYSPPPQQQQPYQAAPYQQQYQAPTQQTGPSPVSNPTPPHVPVQQQGPPGTQMPPATHY